MPKKNLAENQNNDDDSTPEITKPVKTGRKIFKDNQAPVVYTDDVNTDATVPVKVKAKTRKTTAEPLEVAGEPEEPATNTKPVKVRRAKWVWLGILIMLVLTAAGAGIGYNSALKARMAAETSQRLELATTSFVKAERDIANGDLNMASQRLQYIMTIYPGYPGLDDKLKEVLTAIALTNPNTNVEQPTPGPVATPIKTVDTNNLKQLLAQAQELAAAGQQNNAPDNLNCTEIHDKNRVHSQPWELLLDTVNKLRNLDPSFEAATVDNLYQMALRNNGITSINAGKLELGIYYLTLAEKISPLDDKALASRNMAQMYLNAESWYGMDWQKSADALLEFSKQYPGAVDISCITPKTRYLESLEGQGDTLMKLYDYCNAITPYTTARDIFSTEKLAQKLQLAQDYCANPPALPTPTLDPNLPTPTTPPDSYQPTE